MRSEQSRPEREQELEKIRTVYARYSAPGGRHTLWDQSIRGYARLVTESREAIVAAIDHVAPAHASVLDIGCGTGDLAAVVRESRPDIDWAGVDLLPEAVEVAGARYHWATWVVAPADELPFERGSFDVAVASTLFSSLPSMVMASAVASEIERVVKADGAVVWYDVRYRNPWNPALRAMPERSIARLFPGWRAASKRSITVLPPVARRLGIATPVLYPLLAAVPGLRSHLIAVLVRSVD